MNIDVELIEKVVKKVLNDVETGSSESEYGYGIFDTMDEAIEASAKAQKEYMNIPWLTDRDTLKVSEKLFVQKKILST